MKKKHYLVIGGTRGIGKAIAQSIAKEDAIVSVIGRILPSGTVKHQSPIDYWLLDITDKNKLTKTLHEILARNGKISHLIFCQRYRDVKGNWQGELDTSLTTTKNIIELVINEFDTVPERSIVVISSIASSFIALEQQLSYHVAKAALNQMVRYYSIYLGSKGIRINSVSPAAIQKDESKNFYLKNRKLQNALKHVIPLGRLGTPQDISDAVSFLCSAKSLYITGQNIVVDGGLSLLAQEGLIRKLI